MRKIDASKALTHKQKVQFVRTVLAGITPDPDQYGMTPQRAKIYAGYIKRNKWTFGYSGWQRAQAEVMRGSDADLFAAAIAKSDKEPRRFTESAPPPKVVIGETTDDELSDQAKIFMTAMKAREQDARIEGTWSSTLADRQPSVGIIRRMWRFLW